MANQFRVRRGLIVNGSGSALLDIQGSQGQLFSVTDQLSGSLFSVSDASGIPVLEAFSDTSVRLGLYGAEAIIVSGSNARITGSLLGTASFALSASWAPGGGGGGGSLTGGAADYVAVWNSTTTLTTRSLYDNGNVGIGTTSPTALLNISSSTAASVLRVDTAGGAAALFVSGSEFVGIGTTSTSFNTLNRRVVAINGTSTALIGLMTGGTNRGYFFHDATDAYLYNIANGAMIFGTNNAERMRITSGGSVGIGTTSPIAPLQVSGSIAIGPSSNIYQLNIFGSITSYISLNNTNSGTGASNGFQIGLENTGDVYFLNRQNAFMQFRTNNLDRVRITADGNVGIGTTTPTTLLHVSGTTGGVFEVDGASAINAFYVSSSGNVGIGTTNTTFRLFVTGSTNTVNFKGSGSAVFSVDGTSGRLFQVDDSLTGSLFSVNTAAGLPLIEAFSNNTVLIGQYGQNTLYVSQSRVGIGTTIPASRLHVSGTTGGAFQVNGAAATLAFYVSASGRVGIGTTTLLNTFHVVGSGRFTDSLAVSTAVSTGDAFIELGTGRSASGNAYLDLVGDTTYTDYGLRIIRGSAGANATSEIIHRGTGVLSISTQDAASLVLSTLNTARLVINSTGNIGIGTTSAPGYTGYTGLVINNATTGGLIDLHRAGTRIATFYNTATTVEFGAIANVPLIIYTNTIERMRIEAGGNVGIGTSTASSILHVSGTTGGVFRVNGAAAVNALFVSASGDVGIGTSAPTTQTNYRFLQVNGTNSAVIEAVVNGTRIGGFDSDASNLYVGTIGSFPLVFRTAVNERMRVLTNGFVSIGTAAAPEKLTLHSGSIKLLSLQNVANDYRYIGTEYDAGNGNNRAEIRFAIDGSDTNTRLTFHTAAGGGTINERMRISSNGNIGIGTTSPESILHIAQSNAGGKAILYIDNNATSTLNNEATIKFSVDAGASVTAGGAEISTVNVNASNGNADLTFKTFQSGVGLTEKMRIANDGNIGIGTTNPLDILATYQSNSASSTTIRITNSSTANNTTKTAQLLFNLTDTVGTVKDSGYIRSVPEGTNVVDAALIIATRSGDAIGERMRINGAGNVGIGTTAPAYQLQLSTDSAAKPSTNTWTISSDARIKENIKPYTKGLDAVLQINPVEYDYNGKAGFKQGYGGIGIIAQDIINVVPEGVSTYKKKFNLDDQEDTELYNFNSHPLTYILINAIKELKAQNDYLQSQINELKS